MTEERAKRKLSAIFSADVKGYSRLMGQDEAGTVNRLKKYRALMTDLIKQYHGRVVDSPGDNILADFASVVDATECAVKVQNELKSKNEEIPKDQRMEFRIGINLGDVIEDGERIYGDGVNVAARIEGLAEAGGICISGTVHDHVEIKLGLEFEYLGEQSVKNIRKPVRVYQIKFDSRISDAEMCRELPLPDKPSIAVLPFVNMSRDPTQEYFCDGITEEIITALANIPLLFVIARNSTFIYKGKPIKVQQVGRELGVKYVLEGSVRKAEDRIRITAQLIDSTSGAHLWAERYDRNLIDVFDLQDEITLKIITALQMKLARGEQANIWLGATNNLDALEKYCQGLEEIWTLGNHIRAKHFLQEAIDLDYDFLPPYVSLGWCHMVDYWLGLSDPPEQSLEKALELAQKVIAFNESIAPPHSLLGKIYMNKRLYENGIAEAKRAVALNPNEADCHAHLGIVLTFSGEPEEALYWFRKAFRLNPMPPWFYFVYLGMVYNILGLYEKSITAHKKALRLTPDNPWCYVSLAESYSLLGDIEKARSAAAEVYRVFPTFSAEYHAMAMGYKNQADEDRFLKAIREAGLK
jgi:adenylate cyclase